MRLSKALKEKELDLRLRDKHIIEGKVSKAEVDKYLSGLPDETNNMTTTASAEPAREPSSDS